MDWIETNKRFVGFIDIMGFKNLVSLNSHDDILNKLKIISKMKQDILDLGKKDGNVNLIKIVTFFDSILILSNNDTPSDLIYFQGVLPFFFINCIENNIPVKGAVTHGKFTANFEESIFFGQPLIDAYLLQEELYSYSIIAHHSFEKYINYLSQIDQETQMEFQKWKGVMTKLKGSNCYHYILNWQLYANPSNEEHVVIHYEDKLKELYDTVSGSIRKYVDNSIDIFNELQISKGENT